MNNYYKAFVLAWIVFLLTLGISMALSVGYQGKANHSTSTQEGDFQVNVVYDNYGIDPNLTTRWGFGCVVRTPESTVLFDTGGDSRTLLANMDKMNIEPQEIETVIISHIHGDHLGGLDGFLQKNSDVTVYVPAAFPTSTKQDIKSSGADCKEVREPTKITDSVYSTGQLGTWIKEQSLILNTAKGLVIITGCAHPGIVNIVRKSKDIFKKERVYLVMGGFHLTGSTETDLRKIIHAFRNLGVQKVAPSHCSGDLCRHLFEEEYEKSFIRSGAGKTIAIS